MVDFLDKCPFVGVLGESGDKRHWFLGQVLAASRGQSPKPAASVLLPCEGSLVQAPPPPPPPPPTFKGNRAA